jgi:hypothetical protein
MLGSSLVMASFGFMIYSVTSAIANSTTKGNYMSIPVNSDGTISVKLTEEQLKAIIPPAIQPVDIQKIGGVNAAVYEGSQNLHDVNYLGVFSNSTR